MLAWKMTLETAIKFYELCQKFNAKTEAERHAILLALKDEMISVQHTNRTPEQFTADLEKNFKVVKPEIGFKKPGSENTSGS